MGDWIKFPIGGMSLDGAMVCECQPGSLLVRLKLSNILGFKLGCLTFCSHFYQKRRKRCKLDIEADFKIL